MKSATPVFPLGPIAPAPGVPVDTHTVVGDSVCKVGPVPLLTEAEQSKLIQEYLTGTLKSAMVEFRDLLDGFDYIANCQRDLMELGHA